MKCANEPFHGSVCVLGAYCREYKSCGGAGLKLSLRSCFFSGVVVAHLSPQPLLVSGCCDWGQELF